MSKFINRHILLINRKCNFSMFQDVLREKGASCRVWSQFFFIILLVKIFYHVFKRLLFQGRRKSVIAFSPFSTPVKDGTYYVITRGGCVGGWAASPILCLEHISKTMLATVMKLHGWIDLIKAECSAQEP